MSEQIVDVWWETFRNTHMTARQVVTVAIENEGPLLTALTQYAEDNETLISTLRRWLRKHETMAYETQDGQRVCFIFRDNARWQLYPLVDKEVEAA